LHWPPYQRSLNTVFQFYALFPHMPVAQNIGFGLDLLGESKRNAAEAVATMPLPPCRCHHAVATMPLPPC